MAEYLDEPIESEEAIWTNATTLSPECTKDVKVRVVLRLNVSLYRSILAEKKAKRDRTIMETIERRLKLS